MEVLYTTDGDTGGTADGDTAAGEEEAPGGMYLFVFTTQ